MIYIDDIKFEFAMPEILVNYLNNQNVFDVFDINENSYILKDNISELEKVVGKLFSLPIEGRTKLKGLQPSRAEVIANGALIVTEIMKMIGINEITVSEKDNLEGYLVYRGK